MRKVILFLSLILGVGVKAQIVGGYIPLNSSKTPTMGGLKVNGTGTFNAITIPSNSTATQFSITADQTGNVYPLVINGGASSNAEVRLLGKNNSRVVLTNTTTPSSWFLSNNTSTASGTNDFAIGQSVDPASGYFTLSNSTGKCNLTSSLQVAGSFSLGGINYVNGTTAGTIATVADVYFAVTVQHGAYNPGDGLTVYWGNQNGANPSTNASFGRIYLPSNVTLVGYDHNIMVTGTAGSAETSTLYVRVDNTTDIELSALVTYSAASGFTEYHSQALNSNINSGSYLNIKWVSPTWATNPTSVTESILLWFRRRS